MKTGIFTRYLLLLLMHQGYISNIYCFKSPKLTVVIIIDQFGSQYLQKLKPHLEGGLKFLLKNGVNYNYAVFPHSKACTSSGHVLLSTGTFAQYHGIVNNRWWNKNGQLVQDDDDSSPNSFVFSPSGKYNYGKSAKNILVDGLSDQVMLASSKHYQNKVWALSLKSRAAIGLAGKLGKAIWLDNQSGDFTSSKYYFDNLPDWVKKFNKTWYPNKMKNYIWDPKYSLDGPCYDYKYSHNYKYAARKTQFYKSKKIKKNKKAAYAGYMRTPHANKQLIELAKACVTEEIGNNKGKKDKIVLWLSLSGLDKIGHKFGPYSAEAIDTIYHVDTQLDNFIKFCYSKFKKEDVLFVLTGDHGIEPIPQLVSKSKLDISRKYIAADFISDINKYIKLKYNFDNFVQHFNQPSIYCDQKILKSLDKKTKKTLFHDMKKYIESMPGIRKVWRFKELYKANIDPTCDLDIYLQRQLFKGRTGELLISTNPYTTIQTKSCGTGHMTPYNYDTQVSLILYKPGLIQNKNIYESVYMSQLAPTLSALLKIPRPSAAIAPILPKLKL